MTSAVPVSDRVPTSTTRSGGSSFRIVRHAAAHAGAVTRFNERMLQGHAPTDFVLPDRPNPDRPDGSAGVTKYLVLDPDGEARGGFLIDEQSGWLNGRPVSIANYQAPVSEGILDPRYGMVGMHMLRYVQRQWPYAFVVGMGDPERPLPRLLGAAGWDVRTVPFLFRIVRAGRVLRELRPLQQRASMRLAAGIAARTGAGWIAAAALHGRGALTSTRGLRLDRVPRWGEWADEIWARTRETYSFAAARDQSGLARLYPLEDPRYEAYLVRQNGALVGWAVCTNAALRNHAYFGNLQVATILDVAGAPEMAAPIASGVLRLLAERADLVITNQAHGAWGAGFRRAGFASTRSNYLLAVSKPLAAAIANRDRVHMTRGDGDGRIHLLAPA